MATVVALNSNQLGIGMAFVVGALFVRESDDVMVYFRFMAFISILAFIGTVVQVCSLVFDHLYIFFCRSCKYAINTFALTQQHNMNIQ